MKPPPPYGCYQSHHCHGSHPPPKPCPLLDKIRKTPIEPAFMRFVGFVDTAPEPDVITDLLISSWDNFKEWAAADNASTGFFRVGDKEEGARGLFVLASPVRVGGVGISINKEPVPCTRTEIELEGLDGTEPYYLYVSQRRFSGDVTFVLK